MPSQTDLPRFLGIPDGTELIYHPVLDKYYKGDGVFHKFKVGTVLKCRVCGENRVFRPFYRRITFDGGEPFHPGFWTVCSCEMEKYRKYMRENVKFT